MQTSTPTAPDRPVAPNLLSSHRLCRAIVSLPPNLCTDRHQMQERIVFFEPTLGNKAGRLEALLAITWAINTEGWAENGLIYNIETASELIERGQSEDLAERLFETGWGGPEGIHYASPEDVDLFTCPVLKARLQAVMVGIGSKGGAA